MPSPTTINVGGSLFRGSAWTVGLRWGLRGLGVINTFILARILVPRDFGLVAMAMVVVGLVEVLGESGQLLALIRHPDPTREHYDSVWTLGILVAITLTVILWLIAPLGGLYFHEPRAVFLIRLLALRTLIDGFDNVGVVAFRRDLQFGRDFAFQFLQRVLGVIVTVGFALWLRDWRALALGILFGRAFGTVLSYVMHPYRPRLCFTKIPEMLSFSSWMLAVHIAQYINDRADEMVVGGLGSPAAMGNYSVASDTATAPTAETVLPVARALFPVFARIQEDKAAVRDAYLNVLAATCMLSVSVGGGTALIAGDFVAVALGPNWLQITPLVQILAIAGGLYGIMQNGIPVMTATGHQRLSAQITASRAALTLLAIVPAAVFGNIVTIALARTLVTAAFIPGILLTLSRVLEIPVAEMLAHIWRPFGAGAAMAIAVLAVHGAAPNIPIVRLPIDIATGAVCYIATMLLLWAMAGAPAGVEAAVVKQVLPRLGLRQA
jgi:lipopolysaccharide exporter